jgi:hypothetical protein
MMSESLKNTRLSERFDLTINWLKRSLSKFTNKNISSGYGITIDSTTVISKEVSQKTIEAAQAKTSNLYRLKTDAGQFEVVGFSTDRDGKNKTYWQLRHILTGTTVNVPKNVMELIFERTTSKGNENE